VKLQIPCEPGTYNDVPQAAVCKECPQGYYCNEFAMTAGTICDNAYYCSGEATDAFGVVTTDGNVFGMPCPAGSFGDINRNFNVDGVTWTEGRGRLTSSDCDVCTEKYYCDEVGTTEVVGLCARGFMCATGSDRPGPYVTTYIKP
jgi:hypothetical protein